MLQRMLGAGAFARVAKRYPFIKFLVLVFGAVRWFASRRQRRLDRLRMVDVELADDEILVLTREKVRTTKRGDSSHA